MISYMLDTDIASYLMRETMPELKAKFAENFHHVSISCITAAELQFGACKRNSPQLTAKVDAFCELVPVKDWTLETAIRYGKLRTELEAAGTPLASMDMLIAAAALAEGATLVTNNTAHFSKVPGLKLANWLEA